MRITRLHHPEKLTCGETTHLSTDCSNHLIRVLRTKTGDELVLFNGDGFDYHCTTLDNHPKKTLISIGSSTPNNNESNLDITLIQGLSRHDRMDQSIQKSVELGVKKIIPVLCQRSNTKLAKDKLNKKLQHWKKVTVSACEQSGRNSVPELTEVASIENIDQYLNKSACKIILNPKSERSLNDFDTRAIQQPEHQPKSIEIFVGPEGGLNEEEITLLEKSGFESIHFGPRILRTETTGPAVISALQLLWGDF